MAPTWEAIKSRASELDATLVIEEEGSVDSGLSGGGYSDVNSASRHF